MEARRGGSEMLRLLLLLLSLLLGATCHGAAAAAGVASGAKGRDAARVLFGAAGRDEDRGRSMRSDAVHAEPRPAAGGISYETLLLVAHPSRADASQKKVQQMHRGLQLWGHTFVIGLGADGVTETAEGTFGTVFTDLDRVLPDTSPSLTPEDAARVAEGSTSAAAISSKLVIWVDKERGSAAHLAYVVTLTSSPGRAYALVDAKSGEVLRTWRDQPTQHASHPRPKDSSVPGLPETAVSQPGAARRSLQQSKGTLVNVWAIGGNEKVGRIYYNGTNGNPQLQVTRLGKNCSFVSKYVKTGDIRQLYTAKELDDDIYDKMFSGMTAKAWVAKNFTQVKDIYDSFPAVTYPCPSTGHYIKTTDAFKGSYSQQADIQAIMSNIFEMWKVWLKVDVVKLFAAAGVPTPLLVIPHAQPNQDNAGWQDWYFGCGDGNKTDYPICTAGDVLAHELAHGVSQIVNGGLLYYGQPGAWNEGFSDAVGFTYMFFATGRVEPLLGAAITRGGVPCTRNMSGPALYGQSSSALNLTTADPHALSGVPNLAFYKLATSPCFDPKVALITAQRAAHLYFTPTASFLEGANAWVRAARDLGYSTAVVRQAWQDVGLWHACGSVMDSVYDSNFNDPDPALPGHPEIWGVYGVPANRSVYIGNLSYADAEANGVLALRPCGFSFSLTSAPSSVEPHALDSGVQRTNLYVGVNRVPDPAAGAWDCAVLLDPDTASFTRDPSLPSCDLPVLVNATYHVVARSVTQDWARMAFGYRLWGPTVGDDASGIVLPGADGSAPKCFNGGTCLGDSGCVSGRCVKGYCAAKSKRAAVRARRALS